jgi:hypothetical protein
MQRHLPVMALIFTLALVVGAGCSDDDDPAGDGSTLESGVKDGPLWPDKLVHKDTKPSPCSATSTGACGGRKNMYCASGFCKYCPEYYYNCDRLGDCECLGACDGAKCVGTSTKCKYDEKDVCGGDTGQYCKDGKCVACPTGKFNCDKTKDCECTGGCVGKKCQ